MITTLCAIEAINRFVKWCDDNYLYLNISKTKEMCIDFRKCRSDPTPVCIQRQKVERVSTHKYLGVFDNKLCWNENTSSITKKVRDEAARGS